MRFWKKALLTIVALTVSTSAEITSVSAVSSAVNSGLVYKGRLTIGLEETHSPYPYRKNNKLTGFEVDLSKTVAKKVGLKANLASTKWDPLIVDLSSGKFDVVVSNITQTPRRARQYNLSTPYIKSRSALIVPIDSSVKSLKDIKGKKTIAGVRTNNANIAKKYRGSLVPNGDFASSLDMIKQGRTVGAVNPREAWYAYNKKNSIKGLKVIDVSSEQDPVKISALSNRRDTAIQSSYNKALRELQQDGAVRKLSEKCLGTDITG